MVSRNTVVSARIGRDSRTPRTSLGAFGLAATEGVGLGAAEQGPGREAGDLAPGPGHYATEPKRCRESYTAPLRRPRTRSHPLRRHRAHGPAARVLLVEQAPAAAGCGGVP